MQFSNQIIQEDIDRIIDSNISWEKLRNKNVLITGANGMIASYLIFTLLTLNDKRNLNINVIGLVRNEEKAKQHFDKVLHRDDFSLIIQDVSNPLNYKNRIDFIIHAASQASPQHFVSDPVGTIHANTVGTINLLEYAVRNNCNNFTYLSTREIYGTPVDGKEFVNEQEYGTLDPTLVRSCYPESKRISETICASYKYQFGVNSKIARIAHTYGPGMSITDGRVVGDLLNNVILNRDIILKSKGDNILSLTYITDTVAGIFHLILDMDVFVANFSSMSDILTVRELADLLIDIYPENNIKLQFNIPKNQSMGYLSNKIGLLDSTMAIKNGWNLEVPLHQGLIRTIEYFKSIVLMD